MSAGQFFSGRPALALVGQTFYLVRNVPPPSLLDYWAETPGIPGRKQQVPRMIRSIRTPACEAR